MEVGSAVAIIGSAVGLVGGMVGLFTAWKNVRWKRAEVATSVLKDFNANDELVFASRCLDWNGGRLVVPQSLRPLFRDGSMVIEHERRVFERALVPDLAIKDLNGDPRFQIYRTAIDSLLSWLALVSSGINRNLYRASDVEEAGYWVAKFKNDTAAHAFVQAFGYRDIIDRLAERFQKEKTLYASWFEDKAPTDGPM